MKNVITLQNCLIVADANNGRCLSKSYNNNREKLIWQCEYGHIWEASFNKIKDVGRWCPQCAGNVKLNLSDCVKIAEEKNGKCLSAHYKNSIDKLTWQCEIGHIWQASYGQVQYQQQWCPYCAGNAKLSLQNCIEYANLKGGMCLSAEYKNVDEKLIWRCHEFHTWFASFGQIKNGGTWCPHCSGLISKAQNEIYDWISSVYDIEIILNDTKVIKPMHLDIYIPSVKIAIEYDGIYWHNSDWAIKNDAIKRAAKKDELCKQKNISLLRINEEDWKINKKSAIRNIINFINRGE